MSSPPRYMGVVPAVASPEDPSGIPQLPNAAGKSFAQAKLAFVLGPAAGDDTQQLRLNPSRFSSVLRLLFARR